MSGVPPTPIRRRLPVVVALLVTTALACDSPPGSSQQVPEVAADSIAREVLVDLGGLDSTLVIEPRYAGDHNFTGAPLPGYEADRIWLRREAAEALVRVQGRLAAAGYSLKVFDGYRPVRATEAMVTWATGVGREDLLDEGYIARRSRHNMGVAIDLTVIDSSGAELDMGTPYDTFSEAAHTANASGSVMSNRLVLLDAMAAEGFENYSKEWWHFSYPVPEPLPFDLIITERGLIRR